MIPKKLNQIPYRVSSHTYYDKKKYLRNKINYIGNFIIDSKKALKNNLEPIRNIQLNKLIKDKRWSINEKNTIKPKQSNVLGKYFHKPQVLMQNKEKESVRANESVRERQRDAQEEKDSNRIKERESEGETD